MRKLNHTSISNEIMLPEKNVMSTFVGRSEKSRLDTYLKSDGARWRSANDSAGELDVWFRHIFVSYRSRFGGY